MHSRLVPGRRACQLCRCTRDKSSGSQQRYLGTSRGRFEPVSEAKGPSQEAKCPGQEAKDGARRDEQDDRVRRNHFDIQMLPQDLREKLFGHRAKGSNLSNMVSVLQAQRELRDKFKLAAKSETLEYPDVRLPPLEGANVAEHILKISRDQCHPYIQFADELASVPAPPPMPERWRFEAGWVRYSAECPEGVAVKFPDEKVLVFDVEVWMEVSNMPVLAVALSPTAWYAWTSEVLTTETKGRLRGFNVYSRQNDTSHLIPMTGPADAGLNDEWSERLVIGHNVSFDRSYIREEYLMQGPKTRFMDTLSMHVVSSGLNSLQRGIFLKAKKKAMSSPQATLVDLMFEKPEPGYVGLVDKDASVSELLHDDVVDAAMDETEDSEQLKWMRSGSPNSLKALYAFHCGKSIDKTTVEMFISAESLSVIKERFQEGMSYCARDVQVTFEVFKEVYPKMMDHASHPCSFAGMLLMGSCYLPVKTSWQSYVEKSEKTFQELSGLMRRNLMNLANSACQAADYPEQIMADPWLCTLDWSRGHASALPKVYTDMLVEWCQDQVRQQKFGRSSASSLSDDDTPATLAGSTPAEAPARRSSPAVRKPELSAADSERGLDAFAPASPERPPLDGSDRSQRSTTGLGASTSASTTAGCALTDVSTPGFDRGGRDTAASVQDASSTSSRAEGADEAPPVSAVDQLARQGERWGVSRQTLVDQLQGLSESANSRLVHHACILDGFASEQATLEREFNRVLSQLADLATGQGPIAPPDGPSDRSSAATGRNATSANADARWSPGKLRAYERFSESLPAAAQVGGDLQRIDVDLLKEEFPAEWRRLRALRSKQRPLHIKRSAAERREELRLASVARSRELFKKRLEAISQRLTKGDADMEDAVTRQQKNAKERADKQAGIRESLLGRKEQILLAVDAKRSNTLAGMVPVSEERSSSSQSDTSAASTPPLSSPPVPDGNAGPGESEVSADGRAAGHTEPQDADGTSQDVPALISRYNKRLRVPHMANYPEWYRKACPSVLEGGTLEPSDLTAAKQVSPLLLRLTWDGRPLHYIRELGWGWIWPSLACEQVDQQTGAVYPVAKAPPTAPMRMHLDGGSAVPVAPRSQEDAAQHFLHAIDTLLCSSNQPGSTSLEPASPGLGSDGDGMPTGSSAASPSKQSWWLPGSTPPSQRPLETARVFDPPDCVLEHPVYGLLNFYRLQHKDGPENNVGSPLSRHFFSKMEDGILQSPAGWGGAELLRHNSMISYWRLSRARIRRQLVYRLEEKDMPADMISHPDYNPEEMYGVILPRVIVCGTITRRSVEPCWMTISNAKEDRVGSEQKAMVQVPPGYRFVGADVDSEELWISGVLADSHLAREHGCTPIGWMTLQGNKADGTDMHSRTAATVGISRNAAKTFNYARIYGAGQLHATNLLMQFSHRLSLAEAQERASMLFLSTKGRKVVKLTKRGLRLAETLGIEVDGRNCIAAKQLHALKDFADQSQASDMRRVASTNSSDGNGGGDGMSQDTVPLQFEVDADEEYAASLRNQSLCTRAHYTEGSESHLFNRLEEMIYKRRPTTPALGVVAPKTIQRENVGKQFAPCRINWIVQSSGVDYLHCLLVCVQWMMDKYEIRGRLSISIHDEVRYLVAEEDRYRAALALHYGNLLVRSLFAYQLGMNDLPQSVAYFSQVDIDTCMRKEVDMDCKTPSNPFGLRRGHGLEFGEGVSIHETVARTNGCLEKPAPSAV